MRHQRFPSTWCITNSRTRGPSLSRTRLRVVVMNGPDVGSIGSSGATQNQRSGHFTYGLHGIHLYEVLYLQVILHFRVRCESLSFSTQVSTPVTKVTSHCHWLERFRNYPMDS